MKLEDEIRFIFESAGVKWKINGEKITPLPEDIRSMINKAKEELAGGAGSFWVDGLVIQTEGNGEKFTIYAQVGEEDD